MVGNFILKASSTPINTHEYLLTLTTGFLKKYNRRMEQQLNNMSSEIKPKKKKWITVVIFFIIILAIVSLAATEGVKWWKAKQEWVKMGFAHDKFPFKMLTEEELVRKGLWSGESEWYNSIPTRITPEETYAKFRQALVDEDLNKAVECFVKEKQEEWKKSLYDIKEKGYLQEMSNDLPEKLEDTYIYTEDILGKSIEDVDLNKTSFMNYVYSLKSDTRIKPEGRTISFIKSFDGVWLIDSL